MIWLIIIILGSLYFIYLILFRKNNKLDKTSISWIEFFYRNPFKKDFIFNDLNFINLDHFISSLPSNLIDDLQNKSLYQSKKRDNKYLYLSEIKKYYTLYLLYINILNEEFFATIKPKYIK